MHRYWRYVLLIVAIIVVAGCGIRPLPTSTPESGTPGFFSQQVATATPFPPVFTPTPVVIPGVPTMTPLPTVIVIVDGDDGGSSGNDGGLVYDIIQGFILPIWNFFLSLTVGTIITLWTETGRAGGVGAQATCCGLPAILLMLWIVRWYNVRWRRR
jgi:hypothetical protein